MLIATRWVLATEYKLVKEKGMTILLFVVWTIRTPLQKLLKIPWAFWTDNSTLRTHFFTHPRIEFKN